MAKAMGVTFRKGAFRKHSIFLTLVIYLFATLAGPLFLAKTSFALSSADLILHDPTTNHYKVKDDKKTVVVKAYIAGPNSSSGVWPELEGDKVHVFGDTTLDGEYSFVVDTLAPITSEKSPYYGMYEVRARGMPNYKGSSPYNYDIAFCVMYDDGEKEAHCAFKSFNSSMSKTTGETIAFSNASSNVVVLGYPDPEAEKDDAEKSCRTENGFIGTIFCPLVDLLSSAHQGIINWVLDWMIIDPQFFDFTPDSAGATTYALWSAIRDLANLIILALIVLIIISQITGYGISNYGIKKGLPKILMAVILVNTSYFICQIFVNLSNLIGFGLGNFIMNIQDQIVLPVTIKSALVTGVGGGLVVLAILGTLVVACIMNPGMLFMVIGVILAGILAFIVLSVTLGIRKAAAVLCVVTSPLAILCYSSDSQLRQLYDKWFKLFQTVLIAYPLAALFVYGSGLAGKILLVAWGTSSPFGVVISFALCHVPFFFLPKMIMSMLGSISALTTKFQQNITGNVSRAYHNSGVSKWANEEARRRQLNRLSGYSTYRRDVRDKDGNIIHRRGDRKPGNRVYKEDVYDEHGKLKHKKGDRKVGLINGLFTAARQENMQESMRADSRLHEHFELQGNEGYLRDRQLSQKIDSLGKNLDALHLTPEQLGGRMEDLMDSMNAMTDPEEIRNNQAMMGALASRLAQTKAGRKQMERVMGDARFNGNTRSTGLIQALNGVSMGVSDRDRNDMMHTNPYLGGYLQTIREYGASYIDYSSYQLSESDMRQINAEDWGGFDAATREHMTNDALSNPNSSMAAAFNHLMEEVCSNPTKTNTETGNVEAEETESNAHLSDAREYLEQRNATIASGAAALVAQCASDLPTRDYSSDFDYYTKAFNKAIQTGDLTGMESAHKAMLDLATQQSSALADDAAAQFRRELRVKLDKLYKAAVSDDMISYFQSHGIERNAIIQQISLFESRAQGKLG